MKPSVYTSQKMISDIILQNYKMFDNKLLEEFLQLCKASTISINDELELEKSDDLVQQFLKLLTTGVEENFRFKSLVSLKDFISDTNEDKSRPYIFDDAATGEIPGEYFKTNLKTFDSKFSKISATTIEDHGIMAIADFSEEKDTKAAPFKQIEHNTSEVYIYDRYILRPEEDGSRIRKLQSTVLPILKNIISDLKFVKRVVIVGSDMHLYDKAECSIAQLREVSDYVKAQLQKRGFKGKVTCAVLKKHKYNEHGRWIITDYLKLKSDDSWSFLDKKEVKGVGNDLTVFPIYKPRHNKQASKLIAMIEDILKDPSTVRFHG